MPGCLATFTPVRKSVPEKISKIHKKKTTNNKKKKSKNKAKEKINKG